MTQGYYRKKQVIEFFQCDEAFLDRLEAEDLVRSVREESSGETVFAPDQVERIRIILTLVEDLEVNLPGAEVILSMRENMIQMQQQFQGILEALVKELKKRFPE